MRHLSPAQLLDVADNTEPESAFPHLASCDACRGQIIDLRRTMTAAAVDVPEPSPLFWDQLSTRVRDAVAAEPPPRSLGWRVAWSPWSLGSALGVAVVLIAAIVVLNGRRQVSPDAASMQTARPGAADAIEIADLSHDDASFAFVADLAEGLDWDAAAEAGLTATTAPVDNVLKDLSADERAELHRLLREAMGNGA